MDGRARTRERERTRRKRKRTSKLDCASANRFLVGLDARPTGFRNAFFLAMIVFFSVFFECVAAIAQIFLLCAVGAVMEKIVSAMRFNCF